MFDLEHGSPQLTVKHASISSTPTMASERASLDSDQGRKTEKFSNQVPPSKLLPLPVHDEDISRCMDAIEAMDVDLEFSPTYDTGAGANRLIVIIDTNVWIANTALIDEVLSLKLKIASGSKIEVTIMIPWMVLQEIDHLIHRSSSDKGFRRAAKYIQKLLSSKHPRVKGQKASDAVIGKEFTELMADDSILNCVIKCTKQSNSKTVFITNDINLLSKALVHDIASFEADDNLIANLRKLFTDESDNIDVKDDKPQTPTPSLLSPVESSSSVSGATFSQSQQGTQVNDDWDIMEIDHPYPPVGDPEMETDENLNSNGVEIVPDVITFETVISALQKALTNVIVLKMVEEYGQDGWKFALKIKPPFTFVSALKCLQVHWIAVFSYIFSARAKVALDELLELFKHKPINLPEADIEKWRLTVCEMTFALLSMLDKANSRPRVMEGTMLLQKYIERAKAT